MQRVMRKHARPFGVVCLYLAPFVVTSVLLLKFLDYFEWIVYRSADA